MYHRLLQRDPASWDGDPTGRPFEDYFIDASGRHIVAIGDPWNGSSWWIDADAFARQLPDGKALVVMGWK
jgi:hypothetical protein